MLRRSFNTLFLQYTCCSHWSSRSSISCGSCETSASLRSCGAWPACGSCTTLGTREASTSHRTRGSSAASLTLGSSPTYERNRNVNFFLQWVISMLKSVKWACLFGEIFAIGCTGNCHVNICRCNKPLFEPTMDWDKMADIYQTFSNAFSWIITQIARFMGPTWGQPGSCRPQMGPMLAPWTLLSVNLRIQNKLSLKYIPWGLIDHCTSIG